VISLTDRDMSPNARADMTDNAIPFALDGTWQMIRAEFAGDKAPDLVARRTTLVFSGGNYQVRFDGEMTDEGLFEIDQITPHKTLTLYGRSGPNSGRTIRCIFQHVGDRLRVCFGLDGTQPADFTTAPGQDRYLATYRRSAT
jgi:uncharacterized protein (TIGR03067 family)